MQVVKRLQVQVLQLICTYVTLVRMFSGCIRRASIVLFLFLDDLSPKSISTAAGIAPSSSSYNDSTETGGNGYI